MGCTDCGRKGGCDSRKHEMFGAEPVIANYLFYPQPPTSVMTTVLELDPT